VPSRSSANPARQTPGRRPLTRPVGPTHPKPRPGLCNQPERADLPGVSPPLPAAGRPAGSCVAGPAAQFRVDGSLYQQEQARCAINPETSDAPPGAGRTTGRCCTTAPARTSRTGTPGPIRLIAYPGPSFRWPFQRDETGLSPRPSVVKAQFHLACRRSYGRRRGHCLCRLARLLAG
jgi:hypothetical protein